MARTMRYIDEVCDLLLDETECKYLDARSKFERANMTRGGSHDEHTHLVDGARKEYIRAAKEYLAVAFKTKFLGVDLE